MTVNRIGYMLVGGGMTAVGLSFFLGAGPCNATTLGVIAMLLGYVSVPVGLIVLAVGYIFRSTRAKRLPSN